MLIVISISLLFLELVRYLNINFSVWISHANFAHLFPFRHLESLEADLIFVYCTKEDLDILFLSTNYFFPMQLLAYHLTVLRGHNVDQPRNLAKSVTTQ